MNFFTFSVILYVVAGIIFCYKIGISIIGRKVERIIFAESYFKILNYIFAKYVEYRNSVECPYGTRNDAETLKAIIDKNMAFEFKEIVFNEKKYFKSLYKEFKKCNHNFERFINEHFIGVANFLKCYGVKEWDILKDVKAA